MFFFPLHSGIYGDTITLETLKDFHRRRVQILANSGADLIAFETIPNKLEAKVSMLTIYNYTSWHVLALSYLSCSSTGGSHASAISSTSIN